MLGCAEVCQSVLECVGCQSVSKCAEVCQSVSKYAGVCHSGEYCPPDQIVTQVV